MRTEENLTIVYFGNGVRGIRCLEAVVREGYLVLEAVVHKPDSSLAVMCDRIGIPIFAPERINTTSVIEHLRSLSPSLFVLSGYNKILRKELLQLPKHGCINLHGGKLPDYRGAAPINWQILNGEIEGGCTILYADEGIDTGDIIEQATYPIEGNDTAGDIVEKQLKLFPSMLLRALDQIKTGSIRSATQNCSIGNYYCRRLPKDSRLDWRNMSADQIHNLVRAMQGQNYPPAYCKYQGRYIQIHQTRILMEDIKGASGRIVLKHENGTVVIANDRGLLVTSASEEDGIPRPCQELLTVGEDLE